MERATSLEQFMRCRDVKCLKGLELSQTTILRMEGLEQGSFEVGMLRDSRALSCLGSRVEEEEEDEGEDAEAAGAGVVDLGAGAVGLVDLGAGAAGVGDLDGEMAGVAEDVVEGWTKRRRIMGRNCRLCSFIFFVLHTRKERECV